LTHPILTQKTSKLEYHLRLSPSLNVETV